MENVENVRIEKCDKCQENFKRRWNSSRENWSQMNDVTYWTEGKIWNNYKLLCRSCLKKVYSDKNFKGLLNQEKKSNFNSYIYSGLLDKNDKVK